MTKQKAIAAKCLDCAGGSPKEVTLCQIFDCTLWPYRTGTSMQSNVYKKRIITAFKNHEKDFNELGKMGIDIKKFFPSGKLPRR